MKRERRVHRYAQAAQNPAQRKHDERQYDRVMMGSIGGDDKQMPRGVEEAKLAVGARNTVPTV